jgi:aspartyl/asparaginyl beta-hydroxylase (cupin superfamily)
MFYSNDQFPFTKTLEQNWQSIRNELQRLKDGQFLDWPEKHLYGEGWTVFGLISFGIELDKNTKLCPETTRLVKQIPGIQTAGFSHMRPGTHITPHVGHPEGVLRCHLGLMIPENCALRVGDETRKWEEGKCMVFDDTIEHEAWNKSDKSRVVLLLDFKAPELVVNPPKPKKEGFLTRLFKS